MNILSKIVLFFFVLIFSVIPSFAGQITMDDLVLDKSDGLYYKKFSGTVFNGDIFASKTSPSSGSIYNGKKDGHWYYYQPNGLPSIEGYYNEGNKDGIWVYYHNTGRFIEHWVTFKNGKLHGPLAGYFMDERTQGEPSIKEEEGMEVVHLPKGKIIFKGFINYGLLQGAGKWEFFDEKGNLEHTIDFSKKHDTDSDPYKRFLRYRSIVENIWGD